MYPWRVMSLFVIFFSFPFFYYFSILAMFHSQTNSTSSDRIGQKHCYVQELRILLFFFSFTFKIHTQTGVRCQSLSLPFFFYTFLMTFHFPLFEFLLSLSFYFFSNYFIGYNKCYHRKFFNNQHYEHKIFSLQSN